MSHFKCHFISILPQIVHSFMLIAAVIQQHQLTNERKRLKIHLYLLKNFTFNMTHWREIFMVDSQVFVSPQYSSSLMRFSRKLCHVRIEPNWPINWYFMGRFHLLQLLSGFSFFSFLSRNYFMYINVVEWPFYLNWKCRHPRLKDWTEWRIIMISMCDDIHIKFMLNYS